MRLLTFSHPDDSAALLGVRCGARVLDIAAAARIAEIVGMPTRMKALLAAGPNAMARVRDLSVAAQAHDGGHFDAAWSDENRIRLLPPVADAGKFLCLDRNYRAPTDRARSAEREGANADEPSGFVKLGATLVGQRAHVARPDGIARLDCEPALVFVIGKRGLAVRKSDAFRHVAGVAILADLVDRDAEERELTSGARFGIARNLPGFGPLGPELITLDEIADPYDLWLTCTVNGKPRLRFNTREQIWRLPDIVEHFSRHLPLEPGDMVATGAPRGIAFVGAGTPGRYLAPGDIVECAIEGYATLRTTIVVAPGRRA
jgi:2-keto-4-pentenoate hydratase/2-oxohepta-3-ene-1,7-dioic acid hydratase in catechol pathway